MSEMKPGSLWRNSVTIIALGIVFSGVVSLSTPASESAADVPSPCSPVVPGEDVASIRPFEAESGVTGTTATDLREFAMRFNEIRAEACLVPIPLSQFRRDECIEQRLVWIAEDPSSDPTSAWGHDGTARSDGEPAVGCDANLAGGSGDSGADAAEKWWNSDAHRASLYRPDFRGDPATVCIHFSMTHGGVPNEMPTFARAGAAWRTCGEQ